MLITCCLAAFCYLEYSNYYLFGGDTVDVAEKFLFSLLGGIMLSIVVSPIVIFTYTVILAKKYRRQ